jgi:hypothetical protein
VLDDFGVAKVNEPEPLSAVEIDTNENIPA